MTAERCPHCGDATTASTAPLCVTCDDNLSHLYALFHARSGLGFCGCGSPEDAYALVRDILALAPFYEGSETGHPNHQKVRELIGTEGAFYAVLYMLNNADLIEHGGGIGGAWLTKKGRHYLGLMRRYEWDDMEDVGFPHFPDGPAQPGDGECGPGCRHWEASTEDYVKERVRREKSALN